ncbi:hypothetical protein [Arthrobacter sp. CJ23]|uniref:hypothetical protein n=1 Tax=Arthrobacter sp. CJ23 TaxID=2972479 RepID=UPI00215CE91C|nr:hypothetical protein [Arthrobacter sp. CJ23]UVJ39134.1 hypothetical protein NVV90_18300 [Arthrobacter sp. CJ23]
MTTLVAVFAVVFASVAPANAAGNRTVVGSSEGAVLLEPTPAQKSEAMKRLEQARLADPVGFAKRLHLIQGSKELTQYLSADNRFDAGLQQQFLAAAMPTDALEALVSMTDSGYLALEIKDGPGNTKVATLSKAKPSMIGGGKGSIAMKPMYPQCASAWAALWAWWGTNMAFCGAMGFFGPMAMIGCSAAMTIAGGVIDFNRGC